MINDWWTNFLHFFIVVAFWRSFVYVGKIKPLTFKATKKEKALGESFIHFSSNWNSVHFFYKLYILVNSLKALPV